MINNSIERIKNSRAVHNGIWLYIMQTFNSIIPLITLPYITRVLGEAGYGIFSKVFNIVGYLQVIIEYGFGMSGARKAAITTDKKELSRLFSAFIFVRALLLIICCVVAGAVILVMEIDTTECICFISFLIMLIGTVFQQNWLFQGIQKMYYIAIISMVSRLISLIGIFSFAVLYIVFINVFLRWCVWNRNCAVQREVKLHHSGDLQCMGRAKGWVACIYNIFKLKSFWRVWNYGFGNCCI